MASPARGGRGDVRAQLLRPGNEGDAGMSQWGTKQRFGLLLAALVTFGSLGAALPSAGAQDLANRQQPSAAEPDDGAVVLRHPRKAVFWTGGPVSGVALPETCAAGGCHELDLVVTVPPNGVTDLQVGIRWADESEDLDLYVYRPDGSLGDDSAGPVSTAESVLVEDSVDGTYRVVVVASGGDVPSYEGFAQFEDDPRRNGPVDDELLPDLITLRIRQPQIRTSAYLFELPVPSSPTGCYPEETVEQGAQRCLRFDQIIANVGDGPFEIRYRMDGLGTPQDIDQRIYHADGTWHDRHADTYEFHPAHAHFHYENFARAHLWQSDASGSKLGDAPIRSGRKNGFCMVDVELHWWGLQGDAPRTYIPPSCLAPTDHDPETGYSAAVNGISVGWADVYNWYLADQFIEISGVPDGYYLLESVSDPADTVVEVSNTNNTSLTHIRLCGDDAGVVGSGAPCS